MPLFVRCPHSEGDLIVLKGLWPIYVASNGVPPFTESNCFFKWTSAMRPPPHPSFSLSQFGLQESNSKLLIRPVWFRNYILWDGLNNRLQWKSQERYEECALSNHYRWRDLRRISKKANLLPPTHTKRQTKQKTKCWDSFPLFVLMGATASEASQMHRKQTE